MWFAIVLWDLIMYIGCWKFSGYKCIINTTVWCDFHVQENVYMLLKNYGHVLVHKYYWLCDMWKDTSGCN